MTLTSIYEESDRKESTAIVRVGGQAVNVYGLSVTQQFGIANSARFEISNPVPPTFVAETPVEIYLGYDGLYQLAFRGALTTPSPRPDSVTMECIGEGRRLTRVYKRTVETITSVDINTVVEGWLAAAGVTNYVVDLPARQIGAIVPYVAEFTTYGDAINDLARIEGDPWYETPTGQIRVERKDPWPAPSPRRRYFSGDLVNLSASQRAQANAGTLPAVDLQPVALQGVVSAEARPRIRFGIGQTTLIQNVKNRVYIEGAMLDVPDGHGGTTSQRIEAASQAPSPFITTPPTYKDLTLDFPAIDSQSWADEVAARYVLRSNRLEQQVALQVDGDAEVQLGMTVQVEDPQYTRITGNWFVYGLTHQINENDFVTSYDLRGGVNAGTTPLLNPVADFIFSNEFTASAKINQVLPTVGASSVVTYDGRSSFDSDGTVVDWAWSDDQGNTGSGPIISFNYPEAVTSVVMTLTVTDNDGLTDSITKTVNLRQVSECGAADTNAVSIFAAIKTHMTCSDDGGKTWTDFSKAAATASGDFISVAHSGRSPQIPGDYSAGNPGGFPAAIIAMYGTTAGEFFRTDDYLQTVRKFTIPSGRPIVHIWAYNPGPSTFDWWGLADDQGRVYIFVHRKENGDYGFGLYHSDGKLTVSGANFMQSGTFTLPSGTFTNFSPQNHNYIIGGDSSDPDHMVRRAEGLLDQQTSVGGTFGWAIGGFTSAFPPNFPAFTGAIRDAIIAAGPGHSAQSISGFLFYTLNTLTGYSAITSRRFTVMFTSGITPRVWFFDGTEWLPATGLTGGINGKYLAGGMDNEFSLAVLAQLKTFSAEDGVTYVEGSAGSPSQINHVVWEIGMLDVYLAAAASGLVKSLDGGDTWGYIRPHAGVGTTWPVGAEGKQVAIFFPDAFSAGCANIYSLARNVDGESIILRLQGASTWSEV